MKKTILASLLLFISINYTYSQIDTLSLLKKVMSKYSTSLNGSFEYTTNANVDEADNLIRKKVWFVKDKSLKNLVSLRLENYKNNKQLESIIILNEKQKYYINPLNKRSDLCTFNFLKGEELDNFYLKIEEESLPSFMLLESDADKMAKSLMTELRMHENLFLETVNDTLINGINCFGIKITDHDKNNGYIPDITGKGNERYADRKIENTYYSKKDTSVILKVVRFIYTNPDFEKVIIENISTQSLNEKQNTNINFFTIKSDSLRGYFQTKTSYNGIAFIPEIGEYSIKKASIINGITLDGKTFSLDQIKTKYILLGFWSTDCYECMLQLTAFNKEYEELKAKGLTFIAINSTEKNDEQMKEFLQEKEFKFQIIFSKQAGKRYQTNKNNIVYLLLDNDFYIKEVYHELNQDIVKKIKKKLK